MDALRFVSMAYHACRLYLDLPQCSPYVKNLTLTIPRSLDANVSSDRSTTGQVYPHAHDPGPGASASSTRFIFVNPWLGLSISIDLIRRSTSIEKTV